MGPVGEPGNIHRGNEDTTRIKCTEQFEFLTSFPTRGCKIYKTSPERYDEKEGYLAQVDAKRGGVGAGKFLNNI